MSNRPRPRDLRPEGWSPEWVLAWLMEHPGVLIRDAITQWAEASCGIAFRDRIYQDYSRFRLQSETFRAALLEIRPNTEARRASTEDLVGDWKGRFLAAYRESHNRKTAAERAGASLLVVKRALWKNRPEFDQEFYDAVQEIEAETVELARSGIRSSMVVLSEATELGDAKAADALARHSRGILEVREPDQWARQQVTNVKGTVAHLHIDARQRVLANLGAVNRVIEGVVVEALPPAPAEGITIEVPVAQEAV